MKYRFYPLHAGEEISSCEELYDSKEEIRERLADFHSIDWDDDDHGTEEMTLDDLLEHGQWGIKEVAYSCPLCTSGDVVRKERNGTHIYVCDECPYVAYEYYNRMNTILLDMELDGARVNTQAERDRIAEKLEEGYDSGLMTAPAKAWYVIIA